MSPPRWDANDGRLLYNYHIPSKTAVWGLNWTQARGTFVLLSAHAAAGRRAYLDAARHAMAYVDTLQILDRRRPALFGTFHEEVPQSTKSHVRDSAEAAEGYLALYRRTGDGELLYRGRLFADWFLRHGMTDGRPRSTVNLVTGETIDRYAAFSCAAAKVLLLLYDLTGVRRYLTAGARPLLDVLIEEFQRPDGSLSRHAARGGRKVRRRRAARTDDGAVYNDDGGGVALLGGYLRTGDRRYLDAAAAFGEWVLAARPPFRWHSAFPAMAVFLADLWRLSGDRDYLDWIAEHIESQLFARQVSGTGDPLADGGIRGEDEPVDGYLPGTEPLDYVNTRNTCYAALTCFKLAGKPWPAGYTAFGA
jgi:hypothetical protein